jgi:hypothetical protein
MTSRSAASHEAASPTQEATPLVPNCQQIISRLDRSQRHTAPRACPGRTELAARQLFPETGTARASHVWARRGILPFPSGIRGQRATGMRRSSSNQRRHARGGRSRVECTPERTTPAGLPMPHAYKPPEARDLRCPLLPCCRRRGMQRCKHLPTLRRRRCHNTAQLHKWRG